MPTTESKTEARNYVEIAKAYARRAVRDTKRRKHCKYVRQACKRFLEDLKKAEKNKSCPFYFDEWHAADPCDFLEKLPHVEGQWNTATIVLEPWQVFILVNVFGFRRKSDGYRRFSTVYIEVARKNAKSTFSAGVALYCATCEGELGPQVKTAATTGDQARIVFDVARKMAERTPDLVQAFNLDVLTHVINVMMNGGTIKPINAKGSTQDGLNPHLSIIDELHAHKDRSLFDVLRSAKGARKNPLSWYITTAGYNLVGVCYEQRSFLAKLLQGVLEADHYFGVIYTLDITDKPETSDDPYDEDVWIKANPNLGVSVSLEEMRAYAREAKASPDSEGEFKTKRMNVWLNAAQAWLSMERWTRCGDRKVNILRLKGRDACIGGDLADRDDIAALALVMEIDQAFLAYPKFYLPADLVEEKAQTVGTHYKTWADAGILTLTPGDLTDHNVIEEQIREWCEWFAVQAIVFDQYGGAQMMAARLADDGHNAIVMHKNARNYTDPAKELEARLKPGRFIHPDNPCLNWMASNAVVDRRVDGSILPKKETPMSPNKIDGIDAVLMGMSPMLLPVEDDSIDTGFVEL